MSDFHPRNVYVAGLPRDFSDADLQGIFAEFGHIESAKVMRHCRGGPSEGIGFVLFADEVCASRAVRSMAGVIVRGEPLVVRRARISKPPTRQQSTKRQQPSMATPIPQGPIVPEAAQWQSPPLAAVTPPAQTSFPTADHSTVYAVNTAPTGPTYAFHSYAPAFAAPVPTSPMVEAPIGHRLVAWPMHHPGQAFQPALHHSQMIVASIPQYAALPQPIYFAHPSHHPSVQAITASPPAPSTPSSYIAASLPASNSPLPPPGAFF